MKINNADPRQRLLRKAAKMSLPEIAQAAGAAGAVLQQGCDAEADTETEEFGPNDSRRGDEALAGETAAPGGVAGSDSGRASATEFDGVSEEAAATTAQLRDNTGRGCGGDVYASRGSHTKWYLLPEEDSPSAATLGVCNVASPTGEDASAM